MTRGLLSVVCVLLLAAVGVHCQNVCYQPGVDCNWDGNKGGSWLQAMQRGRARAQGGGGELAGQMNDYACECCCGAAECVYSAHLCVAERTCWITRCYARILGNTFSSTVGARIGFTRRDMHTYIRMIHYYNNNAVLHYLSLFSLSLCLEKAESSFSETPEFSAEVLTAALQVRRIQQQREKAQLQQLMENLIESQSYGTMNQDLDPSRK